MPLSCYSHAGNCLQPPLAATFLRIPFKERRGYPRLQHLVLHGQLKALLNQHRAVHETWSPLKCPPSAWNQPCWRHRQNLPKNITPECWALHIELFWHIFHSVGFSPMMIQPWEVVPLINHSMRVHVQHPEASRAFQHPLEPACEKFSNIKMTAIFSKINMDQESCSFSVKY